MSQNSKDHLHNIPSRHVRVSRSIQVGGVEISKLEMSQLLSSSCHRWNGHWECIALDDTGWPGSWTWPRVPFPCLWSQQQFAPQHFWKVSSWDFRFKGSAGFHVKSRFGLRFSQRSRQQTLRSTMFSPAKTLKILALSCIESWKIRDIGQTSQVECCPKKGAPTTSHSLVHCNPHFSLTHFWHHLGC